MEKSRKLELSEKELLAIEAVLHMASLNPRLRLGGTFVTGLLKTNNFDDCRRIRYQEAVSIVGDVVARFEGVKE